MAVKKKFIRPSGATGAAHAPKPGKAPIMAAHRRCRRRLLFFKIEVRPHMCLVGPPNPYILLQSWELTFLIGLTLLNTKLAKKNFFTDIL